MIMKGLQFVVIALLLSIYGTLSLKDNLDSKGKYLDDSNCPGFDQTETKPRFELSKYPKSLVIQDGNSAFIKQENVFEFHLDCWASYPIDVKFTGHLVGFFYNTHQIPLNSFKHTCPKLQNNQRVKVRTRINEMGTNPSQHQEGGYCYHLNIVLQAYTEITGNYSCFKIQDQDNFTTWKYISVYSKKTKMNCSSIKKLVHSFIQMFRSKQNGVHSKWSQFDNISETKSKVCKIALCCDNGCKVCSSF